LVGNLRGNFVGVCSEQAKRKTIRFPLKFPTKCSLGKLSEKVTGSLQRAGQALLFLYGIIRRILVALKPNFPLNLKV